MKDSYLMYQTIKFKLDNLLKDVLDNKIKDNFIMKKCKNLTKSVRLFIMKIKC